MRQHQLVRAAEAFTRAGELFRALNEMSWQRTAAVNLAETWVELGRYAEAVPILTEAAAHHRADQNRWSAGNALQLLSRAQLRSGNPREALGHAHAAVNLGVDMDSAAGEGYWLLDLGHAQRAVGQPGEALESYHRAAVIQRRLGDRSREALAWDGAGLAYLALDRAEEAADFHRQAAAAFRELDDSWQTALALVHLAEALDQADIPDEARDRLREARALAEAFEDPRAAALSAHIRTLLDAIRN